jgi:hypothetical protein
MVRVDTFNVVRGAFLPCLRSPPTGGALHPIRNVSIMPPAAMGRLVNEDANFPKGNIQPLCCRATRGARTFWGEHIPYCFRAPSARGDSISGWGAHFNPSEYKRTPQGFDRQILAGVHDQVTRCAVPAHDAESGARVARVQADPARSCQAAC